MQDFRSFRKAEKALKRLPQALLIKQKKITDNLEHVPI